jgi:O-antigen/teichoic acid export membrane protein
LGAPHLFTVSSGNITTLRLLIVNVGLVSVVGFLSVLPIQCVIAAQRQDALNFWSTLIQVLTALLTALGLMLGAGILLLAGLQLLSGVLNGVVGYVLSRRYLPQAHFYPRWDREQGKLLSSFAGLATLIALASRVIYNTDTLVIATFISAAAAGSYFLALKAVEIMRGLVNAAAGVLGTFVSEQNALGNQNALGIIWSQGTKCSLLVTLPVSGVLVFLGPEILRAWLGGTKPVATVALAMGWLAVGQVFDLAQSTAYHVLMNSGKHKVLALLMICEAGVNLALSIILIRFMGIVGVAIGTSIPLIVRGLFFYPLYMPRVTGFPLRQYVREAVLPPLCSSLPAIALAALCKYGGFPISRGSLPALGLGIAAVTIASAYALCLNAKQKSDLKALVARRIRRNAAANPA